MLTNTPETRIKNETHLNLIKLWLRTWITSINWNWNRQLNDWMKNFILVSVVRLLLGWFILNLVSVSRSDSSPETRFHKGYAELRLFFCSSWCRRSQKPLFDSDFLGILTTSENYPQILWVRAFDATTSLGWKSMKN